MRQVGSDRKVPVDVVLDSRRRGVPTGPGSSMETWSEYVGHVEAGSVSDYIFKLVFIWITVTSAIVSLKHGKWPPSLGAILNVAFLTFFIVVTMAYGLQHGFNGLELGFFSPTLAGFLGVTPLLLFSFLRFGSGNSAAGEMKNPAKDVPAVHLRGLRARYARLHPGPGTRWVCPRQEGPQRCGARECRR